MKENEDILQVLVGSIKKLLDSSQPDIAVGLLESREIQDTFTTFPIEYEDFMYPYVIELRNTIRSKRFDYINDVYGTICEFNDLTFQYEYYSAICMIFLSVPSNTVLCNIYEDLSKWREVLLEFIVTPNPPIYKNSL